MSRGRVDTYCFQRIKERIDYGGIIKKLVYVKRVKDVDWTTVNPLRAGVIAYTNYGGEQLFCFGVDKESWDLTDFGGGVHQSNGETPIAGCLREFMEESILSFGVIEESQLRDSLVVYNHRMLILFLELEVDPEVITNLFRQRVRRAYLPEVRDLKWINKVQLNGLINNRSRDGLTIYTRVRKLLALASGFLDLL